MYHPLTSLRVKFLERTTGEYSTTDTQLNLLRHKSQDVGPEARNAKGNDSVKFKLIKTTDSNINRKPYSKVGTIKKDTEVTNGTSYLNKYIEKTIY